MLRFDKEVKSCPIVLIVNFTLPKQFLFLQSKYEKRIANIRIGQKRKGVILLNEKSANMKPMKRESLLITMQSAIVNYTCANGGSFGDNPRLIARRCTKTLAGSDPTP